MFLFFFFNDTATTEIYTLSLYDALPISTAGAADPGGLVVAHQRRRRRVCGAAIGGCGKEPVHLDRKSTRLNSSHVEISYAVFCLKKKKNTKIIHIHNHLKKRIIYHTHSY